MDVDLSRAGAALGSLAVAALGILRLWIKGRQAEGLKRLESEASWQTAMIARCGALEARCDALQARALHWEAEAHKRHWEAGELRDALVDAQKEQAALAAELEQRGRDFASAAEDRDALRDRCDALRDELLSLYSQVSGAGPGSKPPKLPRK